MANPERQETSTEQDPEKAVELAWLRENQDAFFSYVRDHYADQGRGALIIDFTTGFLDEKTPFHYARQKSIEEQEDEVSRRLATFVEEYEPGSEFVAVFIRQGIEFEFSMYQIRVGEKSIQELAAANREQHLSRIRVELAQLSQLVGDSDQLIEEDIEEVKRRVNGNRDSRT